MDTVCHMTHGTSMSVATWLTWRVIMGCVISAMIFTRDPTFQIQVIIEEIWRMIGNVVNFVVKSIHFHHVSMKDFDGIDLWLSFSEFIHITRNPENIFSNHCCSIEILFASQNLRGKLWEFPLSLPTIQHWIIGNNTVPQRRRHLPSWNGHENLNRD
jgi:hypothetical protein